MLKLAREKGFHSDAVLFPSNVMEWTFRGLVHEVMRVAIKDGIAVQTMKSMGDKFPLDSKTATPRECLQYALSSRLRS